MKLFSGLITYIRLAYVELKKVSFPSQNQVIRRTVVVLLSIMIATLFLATIDTGITQFFKLFIFKQGV